ncbi:putative regulator of sigma factor domain protein [Mycobacterium xenopi 3993]|nr:putative regulator of sigma factor domain protein [Mycobacterium xenopi 3993]
MLGLSADGIADLQLIITELATNSLQHGNGKCWLAFWEHDGHLVCEARDTGFLDDPLAGRRPPSGEETSPAGCSSSTPWPTSCASTQRRGVRPSRRFCGWTGPPRMAGDAPPWCGHSVLVHRSAREYADSLTPLLSGWLSKANPC